MLLRSQAMAYARARAAGFEMDNMDELISFSDTFGASRLRYQEHVTPWLEPIGIT